MIRLVSPVSAACFVAACALGCAGGPSSPVAPAAAAVAPTTLTISGTAGLSRKGETSQFTAVVSFSDGSSRDQTSSAQWISEKPAVATVTATGMVTAVEDGRSLITATFQGVAGSRTVIVDLPTAGDTH